MTKKNKEKIELTPAEDNPWYKFYLQSLEFDKGDGSHDPKPRGWHWFWGIYYLHEKIPAFPKFHISMIQKNFPREHWINNINDIDDRPYSGKIPDPVLKDNAVSALHKFLQESHSVETITEIDFSNLNFPMEVIFSNFIFPISVSFRNSNFRSVNFSRTCFFSYSYFTHTTFHRRIVLNGNIYSNTTFQGAEFHRQANFGSATFSETIDFREVKFFQGASFRGVVFSFGAHFDKAEFIHSSADFNEAKFFNQTSFKEVTFSSGAFFHNAEFDKHPFDVDFSGANFKSGAFFDDVKFSGNAIFYNAIFGGSTVFRGAIFSTFAKFGKADISGSINFIDTHFKTHVPYLHDAKIGTGILWDRNDNFWPQPKQDRDNETDAEYKNRIANNQNDYEALVSNMEKLDKHDDKHFFFRQEMRWRRLENKLTQKSLKKYFNWKPIEDNLTIFFFWLYEIFADYGYGIGRAFSWWLGHIFIGAIVIAIIAWYACVGLQEALFCSVSLSVTNANPFVLIVIEDGSLIDCYNKLNKLSPMIFGAVRGIQTFIGVALLFLLLTTLRVRFRLK